MPTSPLGLKAAIELKPAGRSSPAASSDNPRRLAHLRQVTFDDSFLRMLSGRLEYRPLTISDLDSFHSLVPDEYVLDRRSFRQRIELQADFRRP